MKLWQKKKMWHAYGIKTLLASLRHIREIGPESSIYGLSAFEHFPPLPPLSLPVFEVWEFILTLRMVCFFEHLNRQHRSAGNTEMSLKANL